MNRTPLSFARGLAINVGSSTLKWSVVEGARGTVVAGAALPWPPAGAGQGSPDLVRIVGEAGAIDAVAHRIVHGGPTFDRAVRVDDGVRAALDGLVALDPLHLPQALLALDAARAAWPRAAHVAVFDTAFHATLPPEARAYAVPEAWTAALGVRRYGFHGLSVAHAAARAGELLGRLPGRLVVAHLGSGSSVTAVRDGRSVDTTMGMTPLEGVVMGTRSGSIDPGVILLAQRRLGLDAAACEDALNHRAGLLALSGKTGDWKAVRAAAGAGDERAVLACRVLTLSVRRAVGAMIGSLGGFDAIAFTGGIGEHDPGLRSEVLEAFAFAGLRVDAERNAGGTGDRRIDDEKGKAAALVVEAREDLTMIRAMSDVLA